LRGEAQPPGVAAGADELGPVVGAVVCGAVVPDAPEEDDEGAVPSGVEGADVDGLGPAVVGVADADGAGVPVSLDEGVGVVAGAGVWDDCDDEPPRLLTVVPCSPELEMGWPSASSLSEMNAIAITKTPPATSSTGFHRMRCQTESSSGCGAASGAPGGSATSGCGLRTAGARVCLTTMVRLARAARLRELEYRVAAIVEITEPTAAPEIVPATPRYDAATAAVTAASAPPQIWVTLSPPEGRSWATAPAVVVVVVLVTLGRLWVGGSGRVDGAGRGSGMTPGGERGRAGTRRRRLFDQRTTSPPRSRHARM
jgi:hypothetical protein